MSLKICSQIRKRVDAVMDEFREYHPWEEEVCPSLDEPQVDNETEELEAEQLPPVPEVIYLDI